VKIADFGLSNSIKFGQKMATNCGTPSYTCPEQIMQKKYVGSAADVWSMGVILFAMICGFLPFESNSVSVLYRRIKHRCFKFPGYISKEGLIKLLLLL
jgi:serine/threonine protein kinase